MPGLFYFATMKRSVSFAAMLLLLLFFAGVTQAQKPASSVPLFTFYKLDGKPFGKANILPNKNSLFIFFDVGCDHCQRLMAEVNKKYNRFKKVQFYLISMYEPEQIKSFMTRYCPDMNGKANVLLLQDKNREFIPKFNPEKYPAVYVYSPAGKIIHYFSGEGKVDDLIAAANR